MDKGNSRNITESVEVLPVSLSEMETIIADFESVCKDRDVVVPGPDFMRHANENYDSDLEAWNLLHKELINQLIEQKERFKNVFITESGSVYFVLHTGESLRIKQNTVQDNGGIQFGIQPIMQGIAFPSQGYSAQELDEFCSNKKVNRIRVGSVEDGVHPLEWNPLIYGHTALTELQGDFLIFKALQSKQGVTYDSVKPSMHIGHPIKEIIK